MFDYRVRRALNEKRRETDQGSVDGRDEWVVEPMIARVHLLKHSVQVLVTNVCEVRQRCAVPGEEGANGPGDS